MDLHSLPGFVAFNLISMAVIVVVFFVGINL